jgi:aryl-alcohol dehydrogenase-like predicted oxidoreductase
VVPSIYRTVVDRFYGTMKRLREQGKVRFIGFSERFFSDPKHEAVVTALEQDGDLWDTIMLKYGILNSCAARRALPLAQEKDVGILNMASVRVKLTRSEELESLMADWKGRGLILREALPEKDPLGFLVHGAVDSVVSAGYKFALDHPGVSTVITGTSRISNLERNVVALLGPRLPEADAQRLRALFGHREEAV